MLWLLVLIVVLLGVLGYVTFAPVILEVDSENGLCRIRFHRLASAALHLRESSLIVEVHIAWWSKEFDLLQRRSDREKKHIPTNDKPGSKRKKRRMPFRKMLGLLRSFKIITCKVVVDTGDMPLNGMLFPVFYGLSVLSGKTFRISFNDENEIQLKMKNTLARVAWAYLRA